MYNDYNVNMPDDQILFDAITFIQQSLRQLSYHDDDILEVSIDGIWGEQTENSLISFQRKYGLEPTGVADLETWELLRSEAQKSRRYNSSPEPIKVFPRYPDAYLWDNKSSPIYVQILQYVLGELSIDYGYGEIIPTGVYDDETRRAVEIFQEKNGLPVTGVVDRETWNRLARQHNTTADKSNR